MELWAQKMSSQFKRQPIQWIESKRTLDRFQLIIKKNEGKNNVSVIAEKDCTECAQRIFSIEKYYYVQDTKNEILWLYRLFLQYFDKKYHMFPKYVGAFFNVKQEYHNIAVNLKFVDTIPLVAFWDLCRCEMVKDLRDGLKRYNFMSCKIWFNYWKDL